MATSSEVSCGICLKNGKDKVAVIWCPECESTLCGVCRYQHNTSNKTINHKTTPVGELNQVAQIPIRSRNTELGIAHRFNVTKADSPNPGICAFCLLPNKEFVFVDSFGLFTICNKDGSFQERFSMNCTSTHDIISIDNSTIALACRTRGLHEIGPYLRLVDIKKKTKRTIEATFDCQGIAHHAHHKGTLYLSIYGKGVSMLNLSDYTVSKFYSPGYYSCINRGITMSNSNLCFCSELEDEITLLDPSANIIWKFVDKKILLTPLDITSDANGNIYVLGRTSYNIVFLSADGKHGRQLLGREDGIENVVGIHYDRDRKVLIIVNMFGNVITYNCP